uniref:intermembrane phospholipid transport protein YdbH family protein n=1 Tax=Psychroserpens mesophilus TaxID=325473 RepID=UPI003D65FB80
LDFSVQSEKRYIFEVDGLEAAAFVAQLVFSNLSASGVFDGLVPIVFDRAGNGRIESSKLVARAPGGNLSYIGELTYKDLGFVSNFAFN